MTDVAAADLPEAQPAIELERLLWRTNQALDVIAGRTDADARAARYFLLAAQDISRVAAEHDAYSDPADWEAHRHALFHGQKALDLLTGEIE
jgi:hypothetical protein